MPDLAPRLRWAPKLRREKLRRLYQSDAAGLLDEELAGEVGFALFQRCQSILMVSEARQVVCPSCQTIVECPAERWARGVQIHCPHCDWKVTYGQWRDSWRHQDLTGGNALAAFRAYVAEYPRAQTASQRMLLIDRLIHVFHWSLRQKRFHSPAANNLIEGGLEEVMAFLDDLTYGPGSPPGRLESLEVWRRTLQQVAKVFPFIREKLRRTLPED